MKRIFILFSILFICFSIKAQTNEFAPIGAMWNYESGYECYDSTQHFFIVERDTIVAEKNCRLIRNQLSNKEEIMYEEDGKVYYYFQNQFRKIYDFSVNVGDSVELEFKSITRYPNWPEPFILDTTFIAFCRVTDVKTTFINGVALKEITTRFSVTYEPEPGYVLTGNVTFVYTEKIGIRRFYSLSFAGEFIPYVWYGIGGIPENYYKLKSYQDSDIEYFVTPQGCGPYSFRFVPVGTEWNYESGYECVDSKQHLFVAQKDTIVGGRECKFIRNELDNKEEFIYYDNNGKVYYYFKDRFRKIYDYTVNIGDTVELEFKATSTIGEYTTDLDTTLIIPCIVEDIIKDGRYEVKTSCWVTYELEPNNFVTDTFTFRYSAYSVLIGAERLDYAAYIAGEFIPQILRGVEKLPENYYKLKSYKFYNREYVINYEDSPCEPNSIYEIDDNNVQLFVNNKEKQIVFNSDLQNLDIEIFNVQGISLLKKHFANSANGVLDISNLRAGVYIAVVRSNKQQVITQKIVLF